MKKGLLQIYIGDGKGKTTAAVGQVIRALGHNMRVFWLSFFKDPKKWGHGEIKMLKSMGVDTRNFVCQHPWFKKRIKKTSARKQCSDVPEFILGLFKKNYDLIVLDEVNDAISADFIDEKEILSVLEQKPESVEIIFTGRNAPSALTKKAGLVTEMKMIKHPYGKGIKARRGIEY